MGFFTRRLPVASRPDGSSVNSDPGEAVRRLRSASRAGGVEAVFADRSRSAEERWLGSDRRWSLAAPSVSKQWPRVLNWPQKLPVRLCVTVKGRNTLPGLTLRTLWNRFFFLTHSCSQQAVRGRWRVGRTFVSCRTVTPLSRKGRKTHSWLS